MSDDYKLTVEDALGVITPLDMADLVVIDYQAWEERKTIDAELFGESGHPYEYLCERCRRAHYRTSIVGVRHAVNG